MTLTRRRVLPYKRDGEQGEREREKKIIKQVRLAEDIELVEQ